MRTAEPEQPDDPWLTVAEIATELRCSPATIRSWISRGTLQAMRPGQRKLLVRRSEVDRLLARNGAAVRPSEPGEAGQPTSDRRAPDSTSSLTWTAEDRQAIDPEEWLAVAHSQWSGALHASGMAPPDAWFGDRLQDIAESAARKADALTHFDDDEEMRWSNEPGSGSLTLSYELRPEADRPGPTELWARFDEIVGELGDALQEARAGAIRGTLEELSVVLHDIADSLDQYRGRYGEWREPPPREPADSAGDGAS